MDYNVSLEKKQVVVHTSVVLLFYQLQSEKVVDS